MKQFNRLSWRQLASTALMAVTLGVSLPQASAKTYTVKNLNNSGGGSLRDALQKANSNTSTDTISFKSGLNGEIILTSALPAIDGSVSIQGPGANKISLTHGNGGTLNVVSGIVNVSGLTIVGSGSDSSAIVRNQFALLSLNEVVITGRGTNAQSGLINELSGTTVISDSAIIGSVGAVNGGGVQNAGSLTIINSTLANNNAANGGAIHNDATGSVILTNVTIADNSATAVGGGIVNVTNGTVSLANTIIARNILIPAGTAADVNGGFTSNGNNLIGSTTGSTGFGATDVTNVSNANLNFAGAAVINGGPTPTLAILVGSPAINAGNSALAVDENGTPLGFDQRGAPFARISGSSADIGAFELAAATPPENAQQYKQRALLTISACLPSGSSTTDHWLNKAVNRITRSLDSELWIDGDHLTRKGKKVFNREKQAAHYLLKITSGPCLASAQNAISDLIAADNKLALTALDAAAEGNTGNLAAAQAAYDQAVAQANAGQYLNAIDSFKNSWVYATGALNKPCDEDDDTGDFVFEN